MRLCLLSENRFPTDHQYRGDTTTATAEEVVREIRGGEYPGRYFTYGNRAPELAYGYGNKSRTEGFVLEFDIDHEELVAENHILIRNLIDYLPPVLSPREVAQEFGKYSIPSSLLRPYLELQKQRTSSSSGGEVNDRQLERFGEKVFWCADGPITTKTIEICQRVSQYLKKDWSQVALLHRPVKPSELVRVIYAHELFPDLTRPKQEERPDLEDQKRTRLPQSSEWARVTHPST